MKKKKINNPGDNKQSGGITDKKDNNAGSGAFNQGSEQDTSYQDGTQVSDEEKETGHIPMPGKRKNDGRQ
ncbi:MAG: hypothetical protein ABUT20_23025 [Bacteroidota bacterium]